MVSSPSRLRGVELADIETRLDDTNNETTNNATTNAEQTVSSSDSNSLAPLKGGLCPPEVPTARAMEPRDENKKLGVKKLSLVALERVRIGHPREDTGPVKRVFALFFALQIMINYDSGAVPSVLEKIQKEFGVTEGELGLLGIISLG